MTTRFEQIAAAFPLHCQRIAEIVYEQRGSLETMRKRADKTAGDSLVSCFGFNRTAEGHNYWAALANGAGWLR